MHDILVVEDDETLRKLLSFVLTDAGYSVREARTVEGAVAAISSKPPDLMILDVTLASSNGFCLIERIRDICQNLPLLVHTASDLSSMEMERLKLGKTKYVKKTALELQKIPDIVSSLI